MISSGIGSYSFTNLNKTSNDILKNISSLSSGSKINSASDNPSGMAMINRMQTQIDGYSMATKNTNDGISMVQTAEGAMEGQGEILQRIRELSVQSANGTLNPSDRDIINKEAQSLMEEYNKISQDTSFNGNKLLDGSLSSVDLQTGPNTGDTNTISFADTTSANLNLSGLDLSTQASSAISLDTIDQAIEKVSEAKASMGTYQNVLESKVDSLSTSSLNESKARARIADVDYAKEVSDLIKNQILNQSQLAMASQAKISSESVLSLLK